MPSPKAGTIAQEDNLPRLIQEAKAGRVDFRVDRTSNVHVPIGKVSFETNSLLDNMTTLMDVVVKARPAATKGIYVRRVTLTDTMGPAVKVDPVAAQALEVA
jgi:large subunit ribosomal protein L1